MKVAPYPFLFALAIALLQLGGCATPPPPSQSEVFPVPEEIKGNVAFWRNVYAKWSRGQVALHDDRHMGVIYEVVDLPGSTLEGYTQEQRDYLAERKASIQARLRALSPKLAASQPLDAEEQRIADLFEASDARGDILGAADRVRLQRGLRERYLKGLEVSGRYDTLFRAIFRQHDLPEDLAYLPHVESSFQLNARSTVGAAGVWQFTRGTGKQYLQVDHAIDQRLDPILAAEGAARYLQDAYTKLGSWPLAVTSYNHGQGGMMRAKAQFGDDIGAIVRHYKGPYFGFASRNFYSEFLAAREIASNPEAFFDHPVRFDPPIAVDRLVLPYSSSPGQIARHYQLSTQLLADLNPSWQGSLRSGLGTVPRGTTVWLPEGVRERTAALPATPAPSDVSHKPVVVATRASTPTPKAVVAAAPKAKPAPKFHVVQRQETLYRVAKQYALSIDQLRKINGLPSTETAIRPGQRLRVSI